MIQMHTMPLGNYQTNCYLLWQEGSDTCVVIDPGDQPEAVLRAAQGYQKKIEAILLTHGHFDHVGAVRQLAQATDCRVYLCPEDTAMPPQWTAGALYYTHPCAEGDRIRAGGLEFTVLHTPGHSQGSVCFLTGEAMFSGDTLFRDSCGRTDGPGGSWQRICQSLKRLAGLEGNYHVYPGHGESTELDREKLYNPYMR